MGTESWAGRIITEINPGRAGIITLHGEHDLSLVPSLQAVVTTLLQQGNPVVIDLSETHFLDAPVLGVLVRAQRHGRDNGVPVAVAVPPTTAHPVRRILALTGEATGLAVTDSRDEAIRAVEEVMGRP